MAENPGDEPAERRHDPGRVLALSDGVVAIILTLLVLGIDVPELSGGENLSSSLREIQPSFVAFLISFVIVAFAWAVHRDLFVLIRRTDRVLVWRNMLFLLPLCLLPFGASLLSRYDPEPTALKMCGLILVAMTLTRLAIWAYATGRQDLLVEPMDPRSRRWGIWLLGPPQIAYLAAMALADRVPGVSLTIFALAPIAFSSESCLRVGRPISTRPVEASFVAQFGRFPH